MKKLLLIACLTVAFTNLVNGQCSTSNATSCVCASSGSTNCDLLPDIIVGRPPLLASGSNGVIEYSQAGNGVENGRLRVSVSSPNIGHGPLEIRTTTTYICGTDTITGTAPATCPVTGLPPKQLIVQRVYHKNGNTMSYTDRNAGSMTYHPSHGHMHVDDWGVYTLRTMTNDPNPLNWPIIGTGAKLAFCLMDYGSCSTYNGHCVDSLGGTLLNGNFPNYGLGGGSYNCSPTVQGISSGFTDIYYQYLDGMYLTIPPGTCNGQYYIVVQLDPYNYFLEEKENNNLIVVPYTLIHQSGTVPTITASGTTALCPGNTVTLTSSPALSYLWSNGATTQSINVSTAGVYTVITDATSSCPGTSLPTTVSVQNIPVTVTPVSSAICIGQSTTLNSSVTVPPTGTIQSSFSNNNVYSIPDNLASGVVSPVTVSGISPGTLSSGAVFSVQVNITHTYDADLTLSLISPSGNTIILSNHRGGSGDNFNNTIFSLSAATPIASGAAPFTGSFIPDATFNTLTGNANGTWQLKAVDNAGNDAGTINSWTLKLNNVVATQLTYSWSSVPVGFNSTLANPVVTPQANTTYTLVVNNTTSGCTGNASAAITVNPLPNVGVNGTTAICAGSSTSLTATGAATYLWSPSTGLNTTTGSTVVASPTGTTTYVVTGTSAAGCTNTHSVVVTVNPLPVVTLAALADICNNASPLTLSGGSPSGGTYSGPGVAAGIFNPATSGPGTHTITYSYTNANGCTNTATRSIVVTICSCTSAPGTPLAIQGLTKPCPGNTYTYYVPNNTAVTTYTWTPPANTTILSGQGTNSISLAIAGNFISGSMCVTGTNACGTSAARCKSISRDVPVTPAAIQGPAKPCPGSTYTYSVTNNVVVTNYVWTAPANTTILTGQGTNSITLSVAPGFVSGSLCVTGGNYCGTSAARCLALSKSTISTPATIQGQLYGICQSVANLSVPAVTGAVSYNWILPAGTTYISGQGTNAISFSTNAGFVSGQVCVTASNGCINSAARCGLIYSAPAKPVITGAATACINQTGVAYSVVPVNGATLYTWSAPAGSTIISGQGTTSIVVNFGATAGKIGCIASNSCGNKGTATLSVAFNCRIGIASNEDFEMNVTPNPASEYAELVITGFVGENAVVSLTNILGKEVFSQPYNLVNETRIPLDLSNLSKGIYLVSVTHGDMKRHTRLIVD